MIGSITAVQSVTDTTKNSATPAPYGLAPEISTRPHEHDTIELSNASQVLAMKESGASDAEIAAKLHLSVAEVDADLSSMANIAAKASATLSSQANR